MKKKTALKKKSNARVNRSSTRKVERDSEGSYVILVRSWVFVVLFAIMLGVGVIVGNYMNNQLNGGAPTVAGASTSR
jgi:hypothetical protein